MRLSSSLLASLLSLVLVLPFAAYVVHSPASFEGGFLNAGNVLAEQGILLIRGDYPPGVALLYAALAKFFGSIPISGAVVFQTILFAVGAGLWFKTLGQFFEKSFHRWIVWTASLLNPYFLWLIVTSKDTAFEWFAFSAFFFLLTQLVQGQTKREKKIKLWSSVGLIAAFIFGMLMRVTTVFAFLGSLIVALAVYWRVWKKRLSIVLALCVACTGAFVLYNGTTYGAYTLSTTTSMNLAYGQSPLYEYAHPLHDIDVFLPPSPAGTPTPHPSPLTFIAVSVRKSVWYWLNFEKVPNLSSNTRLIEQTPTTLTLSVQPIQHAPSLLYTFMKLIYIPAFILSLYFWLRRKAWRDPSLVFLAPLLALWPICVLTFPDTRFKIIGEVVAVAFIAYQWTQKEREPSQVDEPLSIK